MDKKLITKSKYSDNDEAIMRKPATYDLAAGKPTTLVVG